MIGAVGWEAVLDQARRNASKGGPAVSAGARTLADLTISRAAEIRDMSRAASAGAGAIVMSSGGTTGNPKITYVPYGQALTRLVQQWRPLAGEDVLLNLFTPGRMWASHYYLQALAESTRCQVVPVGPYEPWEASAWLPTFAGIGVTVAGGTPSALADLARAVLDSAGSCGDHPLPLKKIIWMAEPWTRGKQDLVRAAFPGVQFWGNYGSVETYVIATNGPGCDVGVLHLMPGQILEPDDDGALLTRAGEGWTVPVTRYRLGDRVAAAACRCGAPDGLSVLGRADDAVKLRGTLIGIGAVLGVVCDLSGVDDAQLVLTGDGAVADEAVVDFVGDADVMDVRRQLLREMCDLETVSQHYPGAVTIRRMPRLRRIERTNKVAPMVWIRGG